MVQNSNTFTGGFQGSNANGAVINSGFNAVLPIPLDSVQEFRVTVAGEGPIARLRRDLAFPALAVAIGRVPELLEEMRQAVVGLIDGQSQTKTTGS